jgi:hypothetical protein
MGCIYACQCGGLCMGCNIYKKEEYFGHAEDLAAQSKGYENYDEMLERKHYENQQINTQDKTDSLPF